MKTLILLPVLLSFAACSNTTKVKRACIAGVKQPLCTTELTIRSLRRYPKGLIFMYNVKTGEMAFSAGEVLNDNIAIQQITSDVIKSTLDTYKKVK